MIGWSWWNEHPHGDDLDAEGLGRKDAVLSDHLGGAAQPEHLGNVGAVDIAVEEPHSGALLRQGDCEVDRGRGLPDAPLARTHRDDVPDAGNRLTPEAPTGAHVGRHVGPRCGHALERCDLALRFGLQLVLHRAGRRRELDREIHLAALDLDVLHEAEGHDVLVEIRVLHVPQGGEHLLLGHAHGITSNGGIEAR